MTNTGQESRTITLLRWGLGLLLLWAAVSKIANLTAFLGSLNAYELPLPTASLKIIAVVLPWVELLCGLLLIGRVWPETSFALAGVLFAVFLVATGQASARGLKIACGCFDLSIFGIDKEHSKFVQFIESPGFAFFRNIALLGIAIFLAKSSRHGNDHEKAKPKAWKKGASPPDRAEPRLPPRGASKKWRKA